jgi:hypothetical protein
MSPAKSPKRRFSVATGTAPNADDIPDATTPSRHDAKTAAPEPKSRAAFTWRLTPEQSIAMDDMTLRLKRELGRAKLDRAEMLAALVELAADSPPVFGALVARLQSS